MVGKPPKLTKTDLEAKFQRTVASWLRKKGCTVFKMTPGPGVPAGTPDILFLKEGFWGMVELKKSKTARFQPGQKEAIAKYHEMSWCRAVYPEIWGDIQAELEQML